MGYNISQLKAQYYKTDKRICNYFTYLHFLIIHQDEINSKGWMNSDIVNQAKQNIEEYMNNMKTSVYKFKKDWYKIPPYTTYKFQEDIIKNNENNIDKFNIDTKKMVVLNNLNTYEKVISVCDFYAGKGEWLVNFKKYYNENFYPKIKTLGVELVEERAKCLKENKVDYSYNCAYEDFSISEQSINLLLFNPPYDSVNGERLTKKYLQDIIDKKYLINGNSMIDFVIRIDDFRDCLELLLDHFSIIEETMFKAPSDEYDKFKQVVFTARYKNHIKPNYDSRFLINGRQEKKESLIKKLDNLEEIDLMKIPNETIENCREISAICFDKIMESLKLKNNNSKKISEKNNQVWNWFKDLTKINTDTIGNIVLPKEAKDGEIVNIIASGVLNQQIDNHVVSGGTEQVTEEIKSIRIREDGREYEQIEIRKINKPYLNILLPDGNIKKLLNKTESEE